MTLGITAAALAVGACWWFGVSLWLIGMAIDPDHRPALRPTLPEVGRAVVLWLCMRSVSAFDALVEWFSPALCMLFHDVDRIHYSPHYVRSTCRTCGTVWFECD